MTAWQRVKRATARDDIANDMLAALHWEHARLVQWAEDILAEAAALRAKIEDYEYRARANRLPIDTRNHPASKD